MDLRDLEIFLRLAEERDVCVITRWLRDDDDGVCRSVRAVEREIGAPLFVRGGQSGEWRLNELGERFRAQVMRGWEDVRGAVREAKASALGNGAVRAGAVVAGGAGAWVESGAGFGNNPMGVIRRGDVAIDPSSRTVTVAGDSVTLSRKEFQLLLAIAGHNGAVCSRERLLAEVWQQTWPDGQNTLHVHVAMLRAKLDRPDLIETVHGVGYRLCPPVTAMSRDSGSPGGHPGGSRPSRSHSERNGPYRNPLLRSASRVDIG